MWKVPASAELDEGNVDVCGVGAGVGVGQAHHPARLKY